MQITLNSERENNPYHILHLLSEYNWIVKNPSYKQK